MICPPLGRHLQGLALVLVTTSVFAAPNQTELRLASDLLAQAQQLHEKGRYHEAAPIAARALAVRERELGAKNADTAAALHQLALMRDELGAYPEAEALYLHALAVREETLGPEHPDVADTLNRLGVLYCYAGQYSKSEVALQRALTIYQTSLGSEDPRTALALNSLGTLYYYTKAIDKAEEMYKRSLAVREKVRGPDHVDTSDSIHNLAMMYMTSDYNNSIEQMRRALAIREKVSGPSHPKTANLLTNLAAMYQTLGDYPQAEQLLKRALVAFEKTLGPDHPAVASTLSRLGAVYQLTGAYSMAKAMYQRSLAIYQRNYGLENTITAGAMESVAWLYHVMGNDENAEPLLLQALSIGEKLLGAENVTVADHLGSLGEFYADTGSYAKAEAAYLRALGIRQRLLGIDSHATAITLYDLGNLYGITGEVEKSEQLHLQALGIREKAVGNEHPDVVKSVNALATLSWKKGSTSKALQLFSQAQSMQARNSERFLVANSELRRRAYLEANRGSVFKSVSFAVAQPTEDAITLGLTSVLQYKGRVLDESTDSVARLRHSMNSEDQAILEQLTEVTTRLSNLTYQTGSLSTQEYKQRLTALLQRQETLEADLATRSSEFREHVTPVTVSNVRRAIPNNAALVEWFRYVPFDPKETALTATNEPHYAAFILKRDARPVVVDIGDAGTVDALVQDFRTAVSDPKRIDAKPSAVALSERLMKPLRTHLQDVDNLLISPDGALNLIPMAALVDENGTYLAQRFEISYLTSGRDLLGFNSRPTSRSSSVVMADPEFGSGTHRLAQVNSTVQQQRSADLDRGGLIFRPLENTALEAQDIKSLLKLNTPSVLLRDQATEANIKQLRGPRILHVASHGFFLSDQELTTEMKKRTGMVQDAAARENPLLRSGIALAGANARISGANDDGILTALEVAQLDLHGTELVVLSACNTGVGDIQNGEGVYGLRRALVLAGAQTQVTSLWKVSDEATRPLMVDFYKRLLKGEGRSAALRHAQLQMLANQELSHPYYWASFVPFGSWTPLPALH